jgi:hypothetical protein
VAGLPAHIYLDFFLYKCEKFRHQIGCEYEWLTQPENIGPMTLYFFVTIQYGLVLVAKRAFGHLDE